MISGQQLKQILTYSFSNGSSFLAPALTFTILPSSYTLNNIPASLVLSGSVIPNDGTNIQWSMTNSSNVVIGAGIGLNAAVTLTGGSIPSTVGIYTYNFIVTYVDANNVTQSISTSVLLYVTAPGLYGQINSPSQDIIVPGDLTPYLGSLTITTQATLINLFSIVATNTGRIVIVVPDSYGTVTSIEDNTSMNITSQFHVVVDVTNNRKFYVTNSALTPGTYYFKVNF